MKDSFKSLDFFVTRAVPLIASGFIVLTAVSYLGGGMPTGVPTLATLCALAAFAYPIGLAIRELASMIGLVPHQPQDLLATTTNQSMSNKRWNARFVRVYQKMTGVEWVWPPASAYDEGLAKLTSETLAETTSDERTLHNLNASAHSCAIFGPSCLVAGLLFLMRGVGKFDTVAFAFALLAMLIGVVLVISCWVTLGRGVAFAVKNVSFKPQMPPRSVPPKDIEPPDAVKGGNSANGGVASPANEQHTVADNYDEF